MSQFLLVIAVALTVGAIVFGIIVLVTGDDRGLSAAEPDGRAVPLPADRPLVEPDVAEVRFDTTVRGYRMAQVDAALERLGYDIGYKDELIKVLQSEVDALREGRLPDAEVLRRAREAAAAPASYAPGSPGSPGPDAGAVAPASASAEEAADPSESEAGDPEATDSKAGDSKAGDAEAGGAEAGGSKAGDLEAEGAGDEGAAEPETETASGPFR